MGYNIKMPWFETWLAVSLNLYTRACEKFSPSCPASTSAADLSVKILSPARSPRSVYPVVWSANRTAVPTRTADDYSNIRLGLTTQESVVYSVSKPDSYGTLAERPHRGAQNFYVLGSVEKAFHCFTRRSTTDWTPTRNRWPGRNCFTQDIPLQRTLTASNVRGQFIVTIQSYIVQPVSTVQFIYFHPFILFLVKPSPCCFFLVFSYLNWLFPC